MSYSSQAQLSNNVWFQVSRDLNMDNMFRKKEYGELGHRQGSDNANKLDQLCH